MAFKEKHAVRLFRLIVSLFLLAAIPVPGLAADYFVNILHPCAADTGAPYGTSPNTPWRTLHYAVARLTEGDRLFVAPGVYSIASGESDGPVNIVETDNMEIYGAPGGGTILDGTGAVSWVNGMEVNSASGILIAGLEIRNFLNAGICLYSAAGTRVKECYIHDIIEGEGISIQNCDSTTGVFENKIHDVSTGIRVTGTMGECSPRIVNNLIHRGVARPVNGSRDMGAFEYYVETANAGSDISRFVQPAADETVDEDDIPHVPVGTLQVVLEDDGSSFVMGCFIETLGK